MKKLIATHNKSFHADEVTAIALLKLFEEDEIVVERIDHNTTDFSKYDMVVDIGKRFDGVKYFDHHQYKGGKSSAGLIWEYLGCEDDYPKVTKFIKKIDQHDVGEKRAGEFEYSNLIKCFNSRDIYDNTQDKQFKKAVKFAMTVLESYFNMEDEIENARNIVANSFNFKNNKNIIELNKFTPHWGIYINGIKTPNVHAVVWEDENENNWKVKLTATRPGSFETLAKSFNKSEAMEFVHSSGHFAIASNERIMKDFLKENKLIA